MGNRICIRRWRTPRKELSPRKRNCGSKKQRWRDRRDNTFSFLPAPIKKHQGKVADDCFQRFVFTFAWLLIIPQDKRDFRNTASQHPEFHEDLRRHNKTHVRQSDELILKRGQRFLKRRRLKDAISAAVFLDPLDREKDLEQ